MELALLSLIPIYICYILFLGLIMLRGRVRAIRHEGVTEEYFKAYTADVPAHLRIAQNHFSNQFEVPILFFVTILAAVQLHAASHTMLALGIAFIITRMTHSFIHLGSNKVRPRALSYQIGFLIVLAMWAVIFAPLL